MVFVDIDVDVSQEDHDGHAEYHKGNTGGPITTGYNLESYDSFMRIQNRLSNATSGTYTNNSRAYSLFTVTIPKNSEIISAVLNLDAVSHHVGGMEFTVEGVKLIDPTPPNTTTQGRKVFTAPKADATVITTAPYSQYTNLPSPIAVDVKDVVQELVNAFDYNNDRMMFTMKTQVLFGTVGQQYSVYMGVFSDGVPLVPNLMITYNATKIEFTVDALLAPDESSKIFQINALLFNNDRIVTWLEMELPAPVFTKIFTIDVILLGSTVQTESFIIDVLLTNELQLLKPVSDISNTGAWEDVSFGNADTQLWNELDEITPDDNASAVLSKASPASGDTFEVKLQTTGEPVTDFNHKIRFRARGTGGGEQIKAQLFQGAVLIAESPFETLTTSYQTFVYVLSTGEAGAITDYTDLRIRVVPV